MSLCCALFATGWEGESTCACAWPRAVAVPSAVIHTSLSLQSVHNSSPSCGSTRIRECGSPSQADALSSNPKGHPWPPPFHPERSAVTLPHPADLSEHMPAPRTPSRQHRLAQSDPRFGLYGPGDWRLVGLAAGQVTAPPHARRRHAASAAVRPHDARRAPPPACPGTGCWSCTRTRWWCR